MKARETLLSVERVVKNFGDHKAISSYYLKFSRRVNDLTLIDADLDDHLRISSFKDLVRIV